MTFTVTIRAQIVTPVGWLERLATIGVSGGSAYDAPVAETAREHGLELASLDRRATTTYDGVGVRVEFLR